MHCLSTAGGCLLKCGCASLLLTASLRHCPTVFSQTSLLSKGPKSSWMFPMQIPVQPSRWATLLKNRIIFTYSLYHPTNTPYSTQDLIPFPCNPTLTHDLNSGTTSLLARNTKFCSPRYISWNPRLQNDYPFSRAPLALSDRMHLHNTHIHVIVCSQFSTILLH